MTSGTNITPGGFLSIEVGAYYSLDGKTVRLRKLVDLEVVIVEEAQSGETQRCHPTALKPVPRQDPVVESSPAEPKRDLTEFSDAEWAEAERIYEVIRPLLAMRRRTRADVTAVAEREGVNTSTIYLWIGYFQESGQISSLVKRKRGRKKGVRLLNEDVEEVIKFVIAREYMDDQKLVPAEIIQRVEEECEERELPPPHPNTVRNRLAEIPLKDKLAARGNKAAADQLSKPMPGKFPDANFPLQCIQIDHVKLDFKVINEETGEEIQSRPWLTLAIDVYTRMIVGYYLSLDSPSAFAAGVCLYMSMMPKGDLLSRLKLPGRWPVYGKMRMVHADNAREFKGEMLKRACSEHDIILTLRALKEPRYGAHIERMIGNVNRELAKFRGTTHRSPKESPDYKNTKKAAYTLAALEVEIVDWIVNEYHVRKHSALETTPLKAYERGLLGSNKRPGIGAPEVPADPEKLRFDFMEPVERTIQNDGVVIDNLGFYDEVLNRWMGEKEPDSDKSRKFLFRRDPRTTRKIWFLDPDVKKYFEIPTRDLTRPDMTWAEATLIAKELRDEGDRDVDEHSIAERRKRKRRREEENLANADRLKKKPKDAAAPPPNRTPPGSAEYAKVPDTKPKPQQSPPGKSPDGDPFDDLFDQPIVPFSNVRITK